jgi:hypothetical protein
MLTATASANGPLIANAEVPASSSHAEVLANAANGEATYDTMGGPEPHDVEEADMD